MSDSDDIQEGSGGEDSQNTLAPGSWVSILQMATLLEVDYRTCRRYVVEDRIKAIRIGQYRIYEDEVRYILKNGLRPPNPEKVPKKETSEAEDRLAGKEAAPTYNKRYKPIIQKHRQDGT